MEKINAEIIMSSLISMGFDKVDTLLYTYTLGKLSILNDELKIFKYEDEEYSDIFKNKVDYDAPIIKLKDGVKKEELHTNETLIKILETIDYKEIVKEKFKVLYRLGQLDKFSEYFSTKEQKILYSEFDVEMIANTDLNLKINVINSKKTHR